MAAVAAFQRRKELREAMRPMLPSWSAITFPLATTCSVAEYYSIDLALAIDSGRGAGAHAIGVASASAFWSRVLVPLTLVVVPLIDLMWVANLPHWFLFRPPPVAPESDAEAGS